MVGVFYLDGILLTCLAFKKKKKMLTIFKPFCTLDSSMYLPTVKQLSLQLPCDPSINPGPPSVVCTETITGSSFALKILLYPMLISLASWPHHLRLQ